MNSVNESLYYSAAAILETVEQVTGSAVYRQKAADLSAGFLKCGGAAAAAEKILQVCGADE